MSYRFMRVIVFFDLPTKTIGERREYRRFRKLLVRKGFCMMQESVYTKISLNASALKSYVDSIKNNKPNRGVVQILTVTERQFARMEYICGEKTSEVIDDDSRLVIL